MEYSAKRALATIRIVHFGLIAGLFLFGLFIGYMVYVGIGKGADLEIPFLDYIPFVLVFGAILISNFVFKNSVKKISSDDELQTKMAKFSTAHIMRMAVLEGCGLLCCVLALKSANLMALSVSLIMILQMFFTTPTAFKLEQLLGLSQEEKILFDK